MSRTIASVLAALMLVMAGCGASVAPGSPAGGPTGTAADAGTGMDTDTTGATGTVNLYISDERNAIGDFEHLNVTITQVGFKLAEGAEDDGDDPETDGNDTESGNETVTAEQEEEIDANVTVTATETPERTETPENESDDEREEDDEEREDEGDDDDKREGDGWITYDVNDTTVDLTELQGANASKLDTLEMPNGTYTKVFIYVSEVNGTLKDGTQVNVKLPSQKLQLNEDFTVGNGESVDFVFDITVFKAGNSGMYILKPVVSESGVDQPINDVGDDDEREADDELQARFDGPVEPGANATVVVTDRGEPVENATVTVNGERVGTTDADGRLTFAVPADAEELEVEIVAGDREAELEREFEGDAGPGNGDDTGGDEGDESDDGDDRGNGNGNDDDRGNGNDG